MNLAALYKEAKWLKRGGMLICDGDLWGEKQILRAGFCTKDPITELKIDAHDVLYPNITTMTREALAGLDLDQKTATKCKNMFALGICFYFFIKPPASTEKYIRKRFKEEPELAEANLLALKGGFNYGANTHVFANTYNIKPKGDLEKGLYRSINGNQAVAWGCIAASEKSGLPLFCGSYPITPATVILEELSKRKDLGVKTLQAEDEIAGICTAIGAAFAGNFAVTTTSGPGLSLKSEAIGLAVMTELPLLIVNVQRSGPSTGMPTKPEQADLMQAVWGRNGECPLVVMAASTPSDCFDYAFHASKLTLEHMTPVILLTDGFIANGSEPWKIPQMTDYPRINAPIVNKVPEGGYFTYKRDEKRLARNWAIPGTKDLEHRVGGLEKDFLKGAVSHDPINHQRMVKIRAEKVARVQEFIPKQTIVGDKNADLLVIGWGGTKGHLMTAVEELQAEGKSIALAHFNYINPLPKNTREVLGNHKKLVVCELNEGQFANHLRMNFQEFEYLQYNKVQGLPFTVVELKEEFNRLLAEGGK